MKRIVIVGGGFGGVSLMKGLAGSGEFRVTLVDRNNYNFFPPLLYQLATGFLEVANISYPFRKLMRKMRNSRFLMGEVTGVDTQKNLLLLEDGMLPYDVLVFAVGASTNYFGMENVRAHAMPMKTVNDALELKNHLLLQMEEASKITEISQRRKFLNIVVAGGGPTGVEVSGMLADIRHTVFPKDYPEMAALDSEAGIYLVDGTDAVLKPMSQRSQQDTLKNLTDMGIKVKLQVQVKDYDGETVTFSNGETIVAKTLVWAAGVTCPRFSGMPETAYGRGNRLMVDEYNQVKGLENIYAIGDCALQQHETLFPDGHPQLAQPAIQQGSNLAANLKNLGTGSKFRPFKYWDKGSMAIIGRHKAVVDLPGNKTHFRGFIAWFMWLFVHLVSLINTRNMITTLFNWTGAYFSKDQSLRMIIHPETKKKNN